MLNKNTKNGVEVFHIKSSKRKKRKKTDSLASQIWIGYWSQRHHNEETAKYRMEK